jgi:hypothetical protein
MPLPCELDGNRFDLFRNPGAVNASECQHVVAPGDNGADFIVFMRKHDCFEYSSVEISNGHNCIVRHWVSANQSLALQAGYRTIPNVNISDRNGRDRRRAVAQRGVPGVAPIRLRAAGGLSRRAPGPWYRRGPAWPSTWIEHAAWLHPVWGIAGDSNRESPSTGRRTRTANIGIKSFPGSIHAV